MKDYQVLIVSDGTGETAYRALRAATAQFQEDVVLTRYANVRQSSQIDKILQAAENHDTLIVFTFVYRDLRSYIKKESQRKNIDYIDVLGPWIEKLSRFFDRAPSAQPGLLHRVDDDYFGRIEAIEFALRHDDGRSIQQVDACDLVLVGISRTTKTPLSIFLAQDGWKVANVPVVPDVPLPNELFRIDQSKIAGLTIDPRRLGEIRRARLQRLQVDDSTYANLKRIQDEIRYAQQVFSENPAWPVIDVTGKSLEELSQEILDKLIGRRRRL